MFFDQLITTSYVNSQNRDLGSFIIYLNELYDNQIIDKPYFSKLYLSSNNELGNRVLHEIANYLYPRFYNEWLYNSLNIPDRFKYGKMINASNNLLFVQNNNIFDAFTKLVHPSLYSYSNNKYDACIKFLKNMGYNSYFSDKVLNFVLNSENKYVIERIKRRYLPYNDELECLKNIKKGIITNDYEDFLKIPNTNLYYPDTDYLRRQYINKKTGNLGEYLASFYLANKGRYFVFASRDIGDGLGYDFHVNGEWGYIEIILEAKASLTKDNPNFYITNNEYEIILKNLYSKYTLYLVAKLYVSLDPNENSTIDILYPVNEITFKSIYNNTEYILNENNKFKNSKTFSLKI